MIWFLVLAIIILLYNRAPLWLYATVFGFYAWLGACSYFGGFLCIITLLWMIRPLRSILVTKFLVNIIQKLKLVPVISETEKIALESGSVWIDSELFSGRPNFKKIAKKNYNQLSSEEQSFIDNEVEKVCEMTDDWQVYQEKDLSEQVWQYLKDNKFFGMIIAKEYGGLGFSNLAHSAVIHKLSSRNYPLAITTMVPNSLGPAELIIHYGTDEQKKYYLPRLADGREIPCFALTEPTAGSDAASIKANGVVFKKGDELYIRLNFQKRYITLAAISTVLGLAFKLNDPDGLLEDKKDLGITCALVSSDTEGVILGRRHDPLGVPFYNSPINGEDVEIPLSNVIGGRNGVGRGWKMLMECLAAGRGISLPATGTGTSKMIARTLSNYSVVRQQFGMSIGKFEGIEEPLARVGAFTYLLEASRRFTASAIDNSCNPPVITAICKYHFTEISRQIINDGMDIMGGAAISRGPRNLLAHSYMGLPISITVEGANIITRTLIHFGQGAVRCHPYILDEINSLSNGDVRGFDKAFWGHVGHIISNGVRALLLTLTRGYISIPNAFGSNGKHYRRLMWTSANFAFFADFSLSLLGATMKRKEKLSGRFGDILSWMYLGTCALRRYEYEGEKKEDKPFVDWIMNYSFYQIQKAFEGLFANLTSGVVGWFLAKPIFWLSKVNPIGSYPADYLGSKIVKAMITSDVVRDSLTQGIYLPKDKTQALGRLENAYHLVKQTEVSRVLIKQAIKMKELPKLPIEDLIDMALSKGIISSFEAEKLKKAEACRLDAIQVDFYSLDEYKSTMKTGL